MKAAHHTIELTTTGNTDIHDITVAVEDAVAASAVGTGLVTVSVPGSTGALTTVEYEPGLVRDLRRLLNELVPEDREYAHDRTWGDANGHAHLRASLIGPSVTLPVVNGRLRRGAWQQIVFIDFDTRPRERSLDVLILGE